LPHQPLRHCHHWPELPPVQTSAADNRHPTQHHYEYNGYHCDWSMIDITQQVQSKLCATVHRCRQHKAPQYVTDCCICTSDTDCWQQSVGCYQLLNRDTGIQCSVVGPFLPHYLQDLSHSFDSLRQDLETFSVLTLLTHTAHYRLCDYTLHKSIIDISTDEYNLTF